MLHKHPVFGIVKLRKDNQVMKYEVSVRDVETQEFSTAVEAFDKLIDEITKAESEGFVMNKIFLNEYLFKSREGEKTRIIKVESKEYK